MIGRGQYRIRDAGQSGDLDAVAAAGRPLLDAVQEDDIVVVLGGVQVHIADRVELLRQLCQLKIMGGKQGEGVH